MVKSRNTTPKKGTKLRSILLKMLRPEGYSDTEAEEDGIKRGALGHYQHRFFEEGGWDIRKIKEANTRGDLKKLKANRSFHSRYYLVGRYSWNGKYKSFRWGLSGD